MKHIASEDTTPRASVPSAGVTPCNATIAVACNAAITEARDLLAKDSDLAAIAVLDKALALVPDFLRGSISDDVENGWWPRADSKKEVDTLMRDALAAKSPHRLAVGDAIALRRDLRKSALASATLADEEAACEVARYLARCGVGGFGSEQVREAIAKSKGEVYTPRGASWACLYTLERCFGGHEEGGWWYDWQAAVACVEIPEGEDGEKQVAALRAMADTLGYTLEGRSHTSCSSRGRINAVICSGESFPFASASTRTPHYE